MAGRTSVRYQPGTSLAVHEPLTPATMKQMASQTINENQRILSSPYPTWGKIPIEGERFLQIPDSNPFLLIRADASSTEEAAATILLSCAVFHALEQ
jgi:hypothetical protein